MSLASKQTRRLDYDDAVRLAMGLADFERGTRNPGRSSFHLNRVSLLLEALGNPHMSIPTIHIAGTKGKGSVAAMTTSILGAAGYRVGLYTSPSLHSVTERVRIGMEPIARDDFADLVVRLWPEVERVGERGGYGPMTYFEFMTALAFQRFREADADFQVIEVGLGGRLDATNVVLPEVCAITSISLDHTAVLGDTLPLIAAEKGGIIKRGVPVVVAHQQPPVMATLRAIADCRAAPLVDAARTVALNPGSADLDGQSFTAQGAKGRYEASFPLVGDYQLENAATAIALAETLMSGGRPIAAAHIENGLRGARWPGRFEVLRRERPAVIADGAHNPYSMGRFREALRGAVDFDRAIVVFGAVSGHSAVGMLEELAALDPMVVAAQSRHPKSASVDEIVEAAQAAGLSVAAERGGVGEATRRAMRVAGERDVVVGVGSLSVAAEMIEEIRGVEREVYPFLRASRRRNEREP